MEDRHDDPVAITTAQVGRSEELRHRQNRYLVSMLIRTVCFIMAVVVTGWARWVFIAGALILPYVAVVFANTARRRPTDQADVVRPEPIGELGTGPVTKPAADDSSPETGRDDRD
ncbi:DUF3099 domain-containing protein [Mumia sp. zg.B53]|uniref:DUF3099 domain-containing protein n=1 Tax=unclassified Mumia TaxID=2621872 RepID=UPI001C6ED41C|nr:MULTISPECIES: DUF3099 domain-containing protein [unclassified Mumia]MBW9205153.1 DUF3099 domain-containing protein [Mumia sp. zg.B17]MBW9208844.1 DUF3099 domain-containing protein [Mumia sp. zg.B21]MBW9213455.1 DUF3099 domain-containing protein [Mumia sp. zg.B53]MDD9347973.1 DUF3099 domain-containing protein [Mumia sp.]